MAESRVFQALLATPEPADLGPGPRAGVRPEKELTRELDALFKEAGLPGKRRDLVRALVLLWHDHLDTAHAIAQQVEGPDGAFVHGIMHRREPDYSNAAYWFHRVGEHPVFPELARRVTALQAGASQRELLAQLTPAGTWDALAFIRACEQTARQPASGERAGLLRHIQRLETEALLDWFWSH